MRRGLGLVLIGVGAALLVLAPLLRFYAVPRLAVAPLDLDPNDTSDYEGVADQLFDPATLSERTNVRVTSIRYTKADVAASQQAGGNTGVYDSFSRVNDAASGALITASTERYAFDRTTSLLQTGSGSNVDGVPLTAENIANDAIMPLKLPFFLDKNATYNYYDTSLGAGFPLTFVAEEDLQGLTVYKYESQIPPTQIGEQEGIASIVGAEGNPDFKAPQFYSNHREIWADPTTGQIVNGSEDQLQTFRGPDGTDRVTVIKAKIGYTQGNIDESVAQAKSNSSKLKLLGGTLPLVFLVLGLAALVGGIVLMARSGRRDDGPGASPTDSGSGLSVLDA